MMHDRFLEDYHGKYVLIEIEGNIKIKGFVEDYNFGQDFDEEYDSICVRLDEVITNNDNDIKNNIGEVICIYENEIISIYEI
ncbi:hypothetical protein EDD72_12520 [Tepidibacillus fermentans]|jgi:hypothetical protein|uniref:LSM domain-containing protein n=2 Tax=Tepidibacillus fermentans TaxID=1281767 RepID=A0A4R3K754_9BACI|nr:hypothetical protein [Caloramator sp.]TCS78776.1 hypothetical protein EDD72_12520 [Tepidibacillus fermentans]